MKPSLRFPEFKDEWQEKRLGDVCAVNPRNPLVMPDKFYYIDLESVIDGRLTQCKKMKKSDAPSRAQRLLKKEDVLFQTVRPYQKNNLFFNKNGNFVASTGYAQLRANDSPSFLYQLLHTNNFIEKILVRCTGSNYPAINSEDISTVSVIIPPRKEQEKIADFLRGGDERMVLLEKKVGAMREYKKGVMSAIFSGKLRFKDENGNPYPDWEERRLGDVILRFSTGLNPRTNFTLGNGDNYYITIKNIKEGSLDFSNAEKITDEAKTKINLRSSLSNGDVIMSSIGNVGEAYLLQNNPENWDINESVFALKPNLNLIDSRFLYFLITRPEFRTNMANRSTGSSFKSIKLNELKIMTIKLPSLPEQQKIADFLSAIDHKIELEQTRLDRTKDFKKGLLQRMFV